MDETKTYGLNHETEVDDMDEIEWKDMITLVGQVLSLWWVGAGKPNAFLCNELTLQNISHIQVWLFTFLQPKQGLKIVGTTNSKPPGPIIRIRRSKTGGSNQIIFITLFSSRCTALLCFLPASANMQEKNHFRKLNRHRLTFLHPILMCRIPY
jgi:hypothetical protein